MYPANLDVIKSKVDQVMMMPELCLGPSTSSMSTSTAYTGDHKSVSSSSLTSDLSYEAARCLKKRKSFNDHMVQQQQAKPVSAWRTLDDLLLRDDHHQVKRDRLPLDWEQCLDLKSGKMYFLNRKTSEKSWDRPKLEVDDHRHNHNKPAALELELNISSPVPSPRSSQRSSHSALFKASQKHQQQQLDENKPFTSHQYRVNPITCSKATAAASSGNNMVALACSNCHLLVIVSKSSPSCPNCKYVHYLHQNPNHDTKQDLKPSPPSSSLKPISTLTLFS